MYELEGFVYLNQILIIFFFIRPFYIMLLQADLVDQHKSFCGYLVYSAIFSSSKGLGVFASYS